MRPRSYRLLLVFFLLSICGRIFAQTITDVVEKANKSVVMIIVYNSAGYAISQGSGVFLSDNGVIITNAHVVKNAYSAEVISDIKTYPVLRILYKDETRDLALVRVPSSESVPPEFPNSTEFKAGQRVIAIGNPLGLESTVTDGLISGIRLTQDGTELIQTSVPISPGSSGGVLLNEKGEFIGITTSTLLTGQNINFAISLNTILEFLRDWKNVDPQGDNYIQLKPAKERLWYRFVLHWLGRAILFLIALIFGGGSFYFVIPIVVFAGYLIFWAVKGIIKLVSSPFRRQKKQKEAPYQSLQSCSNGQPQQMQVFRDVGEQDNAVNYSSGAGSSELKTQEVKNRERNGTTILCPYCKKRVSSESTVCALCGWTFSDLDTKIVEREKGDIAELSALDWLAIARANNEKEDYERALQAIEKAIDLDPENCHAWLDKAWSLSKIGRYEAAIEACDTVIGINPNYAFAWHFKGYCLAELERDEEALEASNRSLELDDNNSWAWYRKGYLLAKKGEYELAIAAYDRSIAINRNLPITWFLKGQALGELGKYDLAVAAFDESIRIKPDYAAYWSWKAYCLFRMGNFQNALTAINSAIENDNKNPTLWAQKADYLKSLGRTHEAEIATSKMHELEEIN